MKFIQKVYYVQDQIFSDKVTAIQHTEGFVDAKVRFVADTTAVMIADADEYTLYRTFVDAIKGERPELMDMSIQKLKEMIDFEFNLKSKVVTTDSSLEELSAALSEFDDKMALMRMYQKLIYMKARLEAAENGDGLLVELLKIRERGLGL